MPTLHIVSRSPFTNSALADCIRACASPEIDSPEIDSPKVDSPVVIVLIEDGVNAALADCEWSARLQSHNVFVLEADIAARGLQHRIDPAFTAINYAEFVQLCCDHTPLVSWF